MCARTAPAAAGAGLSDPLSLRTMSGTMRTWTTLGAALGIALFLHAPAWAQTLGELSAAQGVGGSVSAAGASGATTARAVREAITSHLSGSGVSSSGGKSAWVDGDSHGQASSAKGWASARSGSGAGAKGWLTASAGRAAPGAAKGWASRDRGQAAPRRK